MTARPPRPAPLAALLAVPAAVVLLLGLLPHTGARAVSGAASRFVELAGDVRDSDGHTYGTRDGTGRTMDAAQIVQAPGGGYLAVYHTALADGRFHAALATSADLRTWTRRHDFGAGTSQPSLAPDDRGGYVLAYEKDPDNHIAVRGYRTRGALLAGDFDRSFDAPRTLSRCAEGTPDVTSVRGGTVRLTGHYRAACDTDRQLSAVLTDFTSWRARPDQRLDRALESWGTGGNIGDRSRLRLDGAVLVLIRASATAVTSGAGGRTPTIPPPDGPAGSVRAPTAAAAPSPTPRRPCSPVRGAARRCWSAFSSLRRGRRRVSRDSSSIGANCDPGSPPA
ncbi:hypothetical protein ACIPJS_35515 [Streptomyces sp. NPDC086783]|uniref:hypothetical protein n=1 Tax=Streptomyces sp. NPDC086783 TaxID=3365758 RepID=UPI00381F47AF